MANRLYEDASHTVLYQKYRPTPPDIMFEAIMRYLAEKLDRPYDLAVDIGCGPGQSTFPLAKSFTRVIGSDISQEQINRARNGSKLPNVSFECGTYENISVADSSIDLVTAGSSIHWFDLDIFYKEVDRVLKPNGVLAFYTPKNHDISHPDYPELNNYYQKFISDEVNIFAPDNSMLPEVQYKGIKLPYSDAKFYRDADRFLLNKEMSLTHFLDYIKTRSAYRLYLKQKKEDKDVLDSLQNTILQKLKAQSSDNVILKVIWKYCLILVRKPV